MKGKAYEYFVIRYSLFSYRINIRAVFVKYLRLLFLKKKNLAFLLIL